MPHSHFPSRRHSYAAAAAAEDALQRPPGYRGSNIKSRTPIHTFSRGAGIYCMV